MTIMAEDFRSNTGTGGSTSGSETQTRRVFTSKYGYTVEYVGHGLYVLRGRTREGVVRPLWMLVDLISVVYGDDEVEELKRGLGVNE